MRRSQLGLTLIEMLVAVATLGLVAVLVTAFYVQGMDTFRAGDVAGRVIEDVRFAADNMASRLRAASGTITFTGTNRIEFNWWNARTGQLEWVEYRQSGTNIEIRRTTTSNFQPMASNVQTLTFTASPNTTTPNSVEIRLTTVNAQAAGARRGSGLPFTVTQSVTLRNRP